MKLQAIHHRAMALRLAGHTYGEIAEQLHRAYGTVANWFTQDADFRAEFAARTAEATERARAMLEQAAPEAARVLLAQMYAESGTVAVMAARDVLDRAGLKPADKLKAEHTGEVVFRVEYDDPDPAPQAARAAG